MAIASKRSLRQKPGLPLCPLVWRFYSMRRRDALAAHPDVAHIALAEIERQMRESFYLCTQNVDDLHERAGSRRVHHMHGTLFESRCVRCAIPFGGHRAVRDTKPAFPVCPECGALVRPHIVWFGEVPLDMESIYHEVEPATRSFSFVGTSGSVYPAAGFVDVASRRRILRRLC